MSYEIIVKNRALKFIEKQNDKEKKRILKALYALPEGDVKSLKGTKGIFRLRIGDYRVLFDINRSKSIISILNIDNRGDVYK